MTALQMLTAHPDHVAVQALKGVILAAAVVKLPASLAPPKALQLVLSAISLAFPKCGPSHHSLLVIADSALRCLKCCKGGCGKFPGRHTHAPSDEHRPVDVPLTWPL
jgi:hypothetical protein